MLARSSNMPSNVARRIVRNGNPLQTGIQKFLSSHGPSGLEVEDLKNLPKRYTRYGTLLLIGPTFASHSELWQTIYENLSHSERCELFRCITNEFVGDNVTHVAMNAPIARVIGNNVIDNVMRSPTGLVPLFGDFGPATLLQNTAADLQGIESDPSNADFDAAYWTETSQLRGISQVWAPRWTMFSRGNISEKSRIIQSENKGSPFPGLSESALRQSLNEIDVVDFYIGIGYFAFCYLNRGVRRVWGWDINGWSIEGLRRGCIKNGWGVKVVRVGENGDLLDGETVETIIAEISARDKTADPFRCIAFLGNNKWADEVLQKFDDILAVHTPDSRLNVRHCNLGLLPSSRGSWRASCRVLSRDKAGWLHIHENAEISEVQAKKDDILRSLNFITSDYSSDQYDIVCEHVQEVKTYAPGVMHYVFDFKLDPMI